MSKKPPPSPVRHVDEDNVGCHPSCTRCALLRSIDKSLTAYVGRLPLMVEEDKTSAFENLMDLVRATYSLAPRELDVFMVLIEGGSNKEIGKKLTLSASTVQGYVQKIKKKLDVDNRNKIPFMALKLMRKHGVRKGHV